MQGVEKASLGTRYLINYIDDRNPVCRFVKHK